MWNEEELLKEIDSYFDNISEEQFLDTLNNNGCINLVEDIDIYDKFYTYSNTSSEKLISIISNDQINKVKNFASLLTCFKSNNNNIDIKVETKNEFVANTSQIVIGA